VDDLVKLGLAEETDTEEVGAPVGSPAGFAGSVVALVIAAVAAVALVAWIVVFWLAPPFLAWLGHHGI
jgi:hypothetical protein